MAVAKYRTHREMVPWPAYPLEIIIQRSALVVRCKFPLIDRSPCLTILHIRFRPDVFRVQDILPCSKQ